MKDLLSIILLQLLLGFGQTSLATFNWEEGLDIDEVRLEMAPRTENHLPTLLTFRVRNGETSITVSLDQASRLSSVTVINGKNRRPKVYSAYGLPTLIDTIEHHEITLKLCLLQEPYTPQENLVERNASELLGWDSFDY